MTRHYRCKERKNGDVGNPISWLIDHAEQRNLVDPDDSPTARHYHASRLDHERGNVAKTAAVLMSPSPAPRDPHTLETLRGKRHVEEQDI